MSNEKVTVTYLMMDGVNAVMRSLAEAGISPR
ncbi:MAG: hypothetical protein XXXJIFNMEKO3_LKCDNKCA_00121 (plasmid) [Candidatus Erwinia impunctatus]